MTKIFVRPTEVCNLRILQKILNLLAFKGKVLIKNNQKIIWKSSISLFEGVRPKLRSLMEMRTVKINGSIKRLFLIKRIISVFYLIGSESNWNGRRNVLRIMRQFCRT